MIYNVAMTKSGELDALEQSLRELFQTLKRPRYWARVSRQAGIDLDRPAAQVLYMLARESKPLRVHDVAQRLGVEAPSATRKTQELEHMGLLRRLPDPRDRRVVGLRITTSGRSTARRLRQSQRGLMSQAVGDWKPGERRQLAELLTRLTHDLTQAAETDFIKK